MGPRSASRPVELIPSGLRAPLSPSGRSRLESLDFGDLGDELPRLSRSAGPNGDDEGGGEEERVMCALLLQFAAGEAIRRGVLERRLRDQYLMRLLKDDAESVWIAGSRVWGDLALRGDNKWRRWLLHTIFRGIMLNPEAVAQLSKDRTFKAIRATDMGDFKRLERRAYVALGEVFRHNASLELAVFYPDKSDKGAVRWKRSTVTSRDLFFFLLDKKRVSSVVKTRIHLPRVDPHAISTAFLAIRFFDRPRILFDDEIKNALLSERPETMRAIFGIFRDTRETINIPLTLKKLDASKHTTYKGPVDWVTLREADGLSGDMLTSLYPGLPGPRREDIITSLAPLLQDRKVRYSLRRACAVSLYRFLIVEEDTGRRKRLRELLVDHTGHMPEGGVGESGDAEVGDGGEGGVGSEGGAGGAGGEGGVGGEGGGSAEGGESGGSGESGEDEEVSGDGGKDNVPAPAGDEGGEEHQDTVTALLQDSIPSAVAITFFRNRPGYLGPNQLKQMLLQHHVNLGYMKFLKQRNFFARDEETIGTFCEELLTERARLLGECLDLMAAEKWRKLDVRRKGELLSLLCDLCHTTYRPEDFGEDVTGKRSAALGRLITTRLAPDVITGQLVRLVDRGFTEDEPVVFKEGIRLLKSLLDLSPEARGSGLETIAPLFEWLGTLDRKRYGALLDEIAIIIERSLDQNGADGKGGDAAVACVHLLLDEDAAGALLERIGRRTRDPEIAAVLDAYRSLLGPSLEVGS